MVLFIIALMLVVDPDDASPNVVKNMPLMFENYAKTDGTLSISTINSKYLPGQINPVSGKILDGNGNPIDTKIDFVFKSSDSEFFSSTHSENGVFRLTDVSINKEGQYAVIARADVGDETLYAQTGFEISAFQHTSIGKGIFATIIFTISLLILISIQTVLKLRITAVEPLRFALLTLCSLVPIISLIATDVQLGPDSPIGLVLREVPASLNEIDLSDPTIANMTIKDALVTNDDRKFEWIIQVGGNARDNYDSGIKIPVYVFVFGMLGGYIRFLHKSAQGWFISKAKKELRKLGKQDPGIKITDLVTRADNSRFRLEPDEEDKKENELDIAIIRRIIFNSSMEDVALVFLSPIIAFVAFFFLVQGGIEISKSMATLALVSFGSGLITEEVITKLKSFARSAFVPETKKRPSNDNGNDSPNSKNRTS